MRGAVVEAAGTDCYSIFAYFDVGKLVGALGIALYRCNQFGFLVGQRNRRVGDHGAGRIADVAEHRGGFKLRKGRQAETKDECKQAEN